MQKKNATQIEWRLNHVNSNQSCKKIPIYRGEQTVRVTSFKS